MIWCVIVILLPPFYFRPYPISIWTGNWILYGALNHTLPFGCSRLCDPASFIQCHESFTSLSSLFYSSIVRLYDLPCGSYINGSLVSIIDNTQHDFIPTDSAIGWWFASKTDEWICTGKSELYVRDFGYNYEVPIFKFAYILLVVNSSPIVIKTHMQDAIPTSVLMKYLTVH